MSPLKKRMQELNVTVLESAYGPDAEESEERSMRMTDLNISEIKPRPEEEVMRAQYHKLRLQKETKFSTGKGSITGLSIMSS